MSLHGRLRDYTNDGVGAMESHRRADGRDHEPDAEIVVSASWATADSDHSCFLAEGPMVSARLDDITRYT